MQLSCVAGRLYWPRRRHMAQHTATLQRARFVPRVCTLVLFIVYSKQHYKQKKYDHKHLVMDIYDFMTFSYGC